MEPRGPQGPQEPQVLPVQQGLEPQVLQVPRVLREARGALDRKETPETQVLREARGVQVQQVLPVLRVQHGRLLLDLRLDLVERVLLVLPVPQVL